MEKQRAFIPLVRLAAVFMLSLVYVVVCLNSAPHHTLRHLKIQALGSKTGAAGKVRGRTGGACEENHG
jgi:hypothetical protein